MSIFLVFPFPFDNLSHDYRFQIGTHLPYVYNLDVRRVGPRDIDMAPIT